MKGRNTCKILLLLILLSSCKKSVFTCYMCQYNSPTNGHYKDDTKCNITRDEATKYEEQHSSGDTVVTCVRL